MNIDTIIPQVIEKHGFWLIQILVVLAVAVATNSFGRRATGRLVAKLDSRQYWQLILLQGIHRNLPILVWLLAISFMLEIAYRNTTLDVFTLYQPVRDIGVIAIIAWALLRFIHQVADNFAALRRERGAEIDPTTVDALRKLSQAAIIIVAALIILQTLGFSIAGVLAFGGVGGVVIGFAAKDLLANFFGGLMIYMDRPFQVGDFIRSPDREIEGEVESIGWRLTTIRRLDHRPLYVPNATFTSITVENATRMSHRFINETIGLRYSDVTRLPAILQHIREYLSQHAEIDTNEKVLVNFSRFGAYSIDVIINAYVKKTDLVEFSATKEQILFKIISIVHEHGAEMAYPTSVSVIHANPTIETTRSTP